MANEKKGSKKKPKNKELELQAASTKELNEAIKKLLTTKKQKKK